MVEVYKSATQPAVLVAAQAELNRRLRRGESVDDLWDDLDKTTLRAQLVHDQCALCAYCGRRIGTEHGRMKIEHHTPRTVDPTRMFSWQNLLGVCPDSPRGRPDHCDSSRTPGQCLHHHPVTTNAVERQFSVVLSGVEVGRIRAANTEAEHDIKELQLNCPTLVDARERVLRDLRARLRARQKQFYGQFERLATAPVPGHPAPAFAHVLRAYARKKLSQR